MRLTCGMFGLTQPKGVASGRQHVEALFGRLESTPKFTREEALGWISRLPPEAKAFLAVKTLEGLKETIEDLRIFFRRTYSIILPETDAARHYDAMVQPLRETIEAVRKYGHKLAADVALRAVDDFSEWDWDRGCEKGGVPKGEAYATDKLLSDLLLGMDEEGEVA